MTIRHALVAWLVARTRRPVRALAELYGIRLNHHCTPTGDHALRILGGDRQAASQIPASVLFNTRSGEIVVGDETVFGEDVHVLTGKHLAMWEAGPAGLPLHHVPDSGRDIRIGRGCYIGSGAILIGPLEIGDHAVIGAGSVVTRNVPARAFVAGVPARVIRSETDAPGTELPRPETSR
jgi:acetyltransferase-like isoleucine patch superfamily enzyme